MKRFKFAKNTIQNYFNFIIQNNPMKYIFLLFAFLVFFLSGCSSDSSSDDTPDPAPMEDPMSEDPMDPMDPELPTVDNTGFDLTAQDTEGWEMIWEDNFDTNLSQWNVWNSGAFNNELQFYQSSNLFVEDGFLFIEQAREDAFGATNPFDSTNKNFAFTSGRIETKEVYGPVKQEGTLRISARLKLPAGEGLWPAFWSYGDPWPTQGEIDIVEFRGGNTDEYITNFFYGNEVNIPLTNNTTGVHQVGVDLTEEFHVFEVEWSQFSLVMRFDGEIIRTITNADSQYVDDLFNKTEQIVLNLAVGGNFFNGMALNENEIPDQSYLIVDWVKVFKQ